MRRPSADALVAVARRAAEGSTGIRGDGTAARRYREAGFLLTFGQRPVIRQRMLELLTPAGDPGSPDRGRR